MSRRQRDAKLDARRRNRIDWNTDSGRMDGADAGVVHSDAGGLRLGATPIEVRPDGYKVYRGRIPGNVVMDYPDLSPPRAEFIPAEEMLSPESLATMRGCPFTITHPEDLLDATTARAHAVGTVLDAVADWASIPPSMVVDIIVHDLAAQETVESGRMSEISPGYRSQEEWTDGEHEGRRYQVVQRKRRNNHLSGVDRARTVTKDGRAARLDDAGAYPRRETGNNERDGTTDMEDNKLTPKPKDKLEPVADDKSRADGKTGKADKDNKRKDAALSPEDAEILKTMSPEAQALVTEALAGGMAESEVSLAAEEGGELTLATLAAQIADLQKKLAGKTDMGAGQPGEAKKDGKVNGAKVADIGVKVHVDAAAVLAAAASAKSAVTAAARDAVNEAAKFVGHVRRDGYTADTCDEAAVIMVSTVTKHLPLLADAAKQAVKDGRLDALVPLFKQAEQVRRDGLIRQQEEAVGECLRVDAADATNIAQFRSPRPRGATG